MSEPRAIEIVQQYFDGGYRVVFWDAEGEAKGPNKKEDKGWPTRDYKLDEWNENKRVGLMTGVEIEPGKFLHDIDIDWGVGAGIALHMLPKTKFVFGRQSKPFSHCFYTLSEALPSYKFTDPVQARPGFNESLIELRGSKTSGELGQQTMVPPSVWAKDGRQEPLIFRAFGKPTHLDDPKMLKRSVTNAAIGMLLAKHLGNRGFGHEVRMAFAGFLLRAGLTEDEVLTMGMAIAQFTNNDPNDVGLTVRTTVQRLAQNATARGGRSMASMLGEHGSAIVARINEWLGNEAPGLQTDNHGRVIQKSQENIRRALQWLNIELSYDVFSDHYLMNGKVIHDADLIEIECQLENRFHLVPPVEYLHTRIKYIAQQNEFHPVKEYLDALVWDGTPRIDTWIIESAGAEDSPYTRAVSSIFLIAAVRRIYEPGCTYQEMLVLEGDQGWNKSTACAMLCPKPDWFSDAFPFNGNGQKVIEATSGKWIVESSDLAGKRKTEIEQLKANIARGKDTARMAYGKVALTKLRQFVMIGTTNRNTYLTDTTGGRRFWPMKLGKSFDLGWLQQHRDQLWAEALHRHLNHASIRLAEDLWPVAAQHQEQRLEVDPWEDVLRTFAANAQKRVDGMRRLPTSQLYDALKIPVERRDRLVGLRVSEIMQRLGFAPSTVRGDDNKVERGFVQVNGVVDMAPRDEVTREPGEDDI